MHNGMEYISGSQSCPLKDLVLCLAARGRRGHGVGPWDEAWHGQGAFEADGESESNFSQSSKMKEGGRKMAQSVEFSHCT